MYIHMQRVYQCLVHNRYHYRNTPVGVRCTNNAQSTMTQVFFYQLLYYTKVNIVLIRVKYDF